MSKAIARFYHILDNFSDEDAVQIIVGFNGTDFTLKEATKLITILGKAKKGIKVKTSETDFLSEYGAELNEIFPPSAVAVTANTSDSESTESMIRLKKELFETHSKLDDQVKLIAELKDRNSTNLASGREHITLTMKDSQVVTFTKVSVIPDKIESNTLVPSENGRRQEWLNEFNLSDLLGDFNNNIAQVHPGLGYGSLESSIYVLDGSRRRMARIIYNKEVEPGNRKPYDIYIPLDPDYVLSHENALFISGTAKKQKELSSVETGFRYYRLTHGEDAIEQKDLAIVEQVSPSLISELRRVADIPKAWLDAFPDIYKITDSHIKRLYKIAKTIPSNDHVLITKQLTDSAAVFLKYEANIAKITTELVKLSEGILKESNRPKSESNLTPEQLWNYGKSQITLNAAQDSKGVSTLKLSKLPDALRGPMMDEIFEIIVKHTLNYEADKKA